MGVRIDFPISKQDIAEMTGTTLHTVSRILTAWEAAGLVEGGRQKLLVRDPHQLVLIGDGLKPGAISEPRPFDVCNQSSMQEAVFFCRVDQGVERRYRTSYTVHAAVQEHPDGRRPLWHDLREA